jgi:integrase
MASVVKYPKSKYWIAAFRDASGKQYRRTTRETSRKRALAVAEQFERVVQRQANAARIRKTFSEFYREHYGEALPLATVRDYATQWLASRKAETSMVSHQLYATALDKFLAFLGPRADAALDEITRAQVAAFRDARLAVSAPATANGQLQVVKMLFKAARRDGFLLDDPAESVKPAKRMATFERRAFTIDELRAIIALANDEWRSLIKFGLYTGQRLGDLATLTWSQVDLERDEVRLTPRKTNKPLLIPIAGPLREHLLSLTTGDNPRSPIHPRALATMTACHGRVSMLSKAFAEMLIAAGLRVPLRTPGGVGRSGKRAGYALSFHSLRHTAVSLMKDAGVPDAVVMALVGHDSKAMSQHYTHVGIEALAKAARSMPEI